MLTVIIPIYNEQNIIKEILEKIESQDQIKKQIINDGSTDLSYQIIKNYPFKSEVKILNNIQNKGKGSCIKYAQRFIRGDIVLIQDADLEYDPKFYNVLIKPIIENKNLVVYGSRVLNKKRYGDNNFISIFRVFANHMLTLFSNIINKQHLTDAHTCYKVVRADVFKKIKLEHDDFSFCPELTTKLSNEKIPIIEVSIDYNGRNESEGKKIKFKDGILAVLTIIKFKLKSKKN